MAGFGSFVTADAERLSTLLADAMRRARLRGIIQAGWSGLHAEKDDLITVQEVPHAWLFPRTATVQSPALRARARDIAAALAREDGTRQVLTAIERLAPSGNSVP